MPLISIVSGCYNEEENVKELYQRIKAVFKNLPQYRYEIIFIDNASEDKTVEVLKSIAEEDKDVKIIVNARNFGHIRSPYHALTQAKGDAIIAMASDLQDPPELIKGFIKKWEEGYKIVVGVKSDTQETFLMKFVRHLYYKFVTKIADTKLVKNFTGFGLYDKKIIDILKKIDDPYPYFRGLIAEIGFEIVGVPFYQQQRKKGITKNNFYTLYDMAMLGITSHSKIPIRLATIFGFSLSVLSLIIALIFFVLKLLFWSKFSFGLAPILVGVFFFASIQLFFIGLLGEYIAAIHVQVLKRPRVIEKERINFDKD